MSILSRLRSSQSLRRRYETAKKYTETVNWINVVVAICFALAIIFLILGLVWLSQGDANIARTWIFFSLGLCGTILGITYCIFRFTSRLPIKSTSRRRRRTRHAQSRSNRVWTTPQSSHHHQPDIRTCEALRNVNAAPPTYEEAIGVNRTSTNAVIESTPPPYGRPAR